MLVRIFIGICMLALTAGAATYYVDYDDGSDAAAGTSESTAWKHAPGDAEAGGNAAAATLQSGDIVLFRGGVTYYGSITIPASGEAGNPITYKGDGWGTERAVVDGSVPFTGGWTQCSSADQVRGNADYASIYHTGAPASGYAYTTGTFEEHSFIYPAQDPEPTDPFHGERRDQMRMVPLDDATAYQTDTSITDPRYFTSDDPQFFDGAYLAIWHNPNVTHHYAVTGYDPATATVFHEPVSASGGNVYTDRDTYYAVVNHPAYLSNPGSYFHDASANRLYVRTAPGTEPATLEYGYTERGCGFYAQRKSHVVIEGFVIQKFAAGIRCIDGDASHTFIRNNHVRSLKCNEGYAVQVAGTDMYVDSNRVEDCHRGVGILMAGTNTHARGNTVIRTSRQGIWAMGNEHCVIADNYLDDLNGTHCNGISVYLYNEDVLVARNRVMNSQLPMTWHGDRDAGLYVNLTLFGNVFEGKGQSWEKEMHGCTAVNNTFTGGFFTADLDDGITNVNNIQDAGGSGDIVRTHNVYTALGWWQRDSYGWYLDPTEVDYSDGDWNELYADTAADDYSVLEASVARDAGTDPAAYLPVDLFPEFDFTRDINGNTFGADGVWDIGAFEYIADAVRGIECGMRNAPPSIPNPARLRSLREYDGTLMTLDGVPVDAGSGVMLYMLDGTLQRIVVLP